MSQKLIWIVEDDEAIRLTLRDILELKGFETQMANNGKMAYEMLKKEDIGGKLPDLIFLDLMMPFMGGKEFIEAMKKHPEFENIPVILLSATSDLSKTPAGVRRLPKPIVFDDLNNALQETLGSSG